jgi:hypothetical protein
MDAKVTAIKSIMEAEVESESNWTSYQRMFERAMYKGNRFLADEAPPETNTAPGAAGESAGVDKSGREDRGGSGGSGGKAGEEGGYDKADEASEPDLFSKNLR